MELRILEYFIVVASELNITRAANILHITQPTLSRQLHNLENELGVKLFVRKNGAIALTKEGIYLKNKAEQIISLANETKFNISQTKEEITGTLAIGMAECNGSNLLLPQYLNIFCKLYPKVLINLSVDTADTVKEQIDKGLLDVAIVIEPADIDKYESIRLPIEEKWGIIMNSNDPLAEKEYITADMLSNSNMLYSKRLELQILFEKWMNNKACTINVKGYYNSISGACIMIKNGMGRAFAMNGSVEHYPLIFKPIKPELTTHSSLIWKKDSLQSKALNEFLKVAKNFCEKI